MKEYYYQKILSYENSSYAFLYRIDFQSELDMVFVLTENEENAPYSNKKTHTHNYVYYYYDNGVLTQIKNSVIKPIAYKFEEDVNLIDGEMLGQGDTQLLNDSYYNEPEYSYKPSGEYYNATIITNILCFESEEAVLNYYQNGDMSGIVNFNTDERVSVHISDSSNITKLYNFYPSSPFSDTSLSQLDTYNYHTNAIKQSRYSDAAKELSLSYPELKGGTAHILNDFEKSIRALEQRVENYEPTDSQYVNSDIEPSSYISINSSPIRFTIWQQEFVEDLATCEQALYEHFGVSKEDYPYLAVYFFESTDLRLEIIFSSGIIDIYNTNTRTRVQAPYCYYYQSSSLYYGTVLSTDMSAITNAIINSIETWSGYSMDEGTSDYPASSTNITHYLYTNFDDEYSSGRLDETFC